MQFITVAFDGSSHVARCGGGPAVLADEFAGKIAGEVSDSF
jgi:hypothetical protein